MLEHDKAIPQEKIDISEEERLPALFLQGKKQEIRIFGFPATIGRNSELVDAPLIEYSVSRRHCEFDLREGQIVLTDLGSYVGTFIGRRRLIEGEACPVKDRQVIRIGKEKFRAFINYEEVSRLEEQENATEVEGAEGEYPSPLEVEASAAPTPEEAAQAEAEVAPMPEEAAPVPNAGPAPSLEPASAEPAPAELATLSMETAVPEHVAVAPEHATTEETEGSTVESV